METKFQNIVSSGSRVVKYWWLTLIFGILLCIMGVVVFMYPAESYLSLALIFGVLILISGIFQIVFAVNNRECMRGWGWLLAGGIIEIILGIILASNLGLSVLTLPIFLAFWLMFRSFTTMGIGGDMQAMRIPGAIWTIVAGVLLLLLSIWMLIQPLAFGTTVVVVWLGITFLFAGISAIMLSMQLKNIYRHIG